MVKFQPLWTSIRFPNFKLKFKLGGLLLCLILLSDYHPVFNFPPIKKNIVYAEITQEQTITPQTLGITFQLPHPGYITTPFSGNHPGIDLCSGLGTPIKPIAEGVISNAGYNFFGLGLVVEVDHKNGYHSLYAHMGKIYVKKGQEVGINDFVGEIGMTGHTSGPHTHLEVSKDGTKIDPRLILPEIRNYPKEEDFVKIESATPSAVVIPSLAPAPIASESAKTNILSTPNTEPIKDLLQSKPTESKTDLKQQKIETILNLASPKPSVAPLPQGGKISLRDFHFFKLR